MSFSSFLNEFVILFNNKYTITLGIGLMRINEFTATDDLEEAPVGMMKRAAQGLGSKVLNKIPGAKNKAANLAGKADLSDTANNLYKEFSKFIGTQGKNIKQATGEELDAFLKSKKAVVQGIPSGVLTKPQINDVLMKAAKDAMAKQAGANIQQPGGDQAAQDDATGEPAQSEPSAGGKIEFTPNQPVMFTNKAGQTVQATVVGKSEDGDESKVSVKGAKGQTFNVSRDKLVDPKTKKPFKPGAAPKSAPATSGKVPAKLQKQINALNPKQKQELAALL
jgi:hypothetical protein